MKNSYILIFCALIYTSSNAQTTAIPDSNFEQKLIDLGIDSDGIINGQVLTSDIETVITLDVRFRNISDLTGIEDFTILEDLIVLGNNLSILDTSENTLLRTLDCSVNPLNSIIILNNILLESFVIINAHQLDNIDFSNNINLESLTIEDCWLNTIDISNNINLKTLIIGGGGFSEIDFSNNILLEHLDVAGVHLNTLDVSNNVLLKELYCGNYGGDWGQSISSLDLSYNVNLELLYSENLFQLDNLNLKNGNNDILLTVTLPCDIEGETCELPYLNCVIVDDEVSANNDEPPYSGWYIQADFIYSGDCILGIQSQKEKVFSMYPNPVKDELIVSSSKNNIGNLRAQIFTIEGKIIQTQELNFEKQATINVSSFSKGVYFISLQNKNGQREVLKFVKE